MAEKLYPPIIPGKIPAFYKKEESGTVKAEITVPFSISKGVNTNDIIGFSLQLKTVQNNFICNISKEFITNEEEEKEELQNILLKKEIVFEINNNEHLKKINIGQFFKLQMAFISKDNQSSLTGYYSTVGVIKCTTKPAINIEGLGVGNNSPLPIYFIKYENQDSTEMPYTYSFSLYDKDNNEILNKENLLYDSFEENNNFFFLNIDFTKNDSYTLSLEIKTINNLKEKIEYTIKETSNNRTCDLAGAITSKVENNSDNGYISIKFIAKENIFILNESATEINSTDYDIESELNNNNITFVNYESSNDQYPYMCKIIEDNSCYCYLFPNYKKFKIYRKDNMNNEINIYNYKFIQNRENNKIFDISQNELIFEFKDFNIEQGVEYSYFYKEELDESRNSNSSNGRDSRFSILSEKKDISEKGLMANFEDIFLSDNKGKQIKIKFNPKISSFKTNHLEQKTETIGNKYPFIFRNGTVEYKEFPISGLISYHLDNNESFITKKELYLEDKILKRQNSPYNLFSENNYDNKNFSTTNLIDYNIYAERKFKLALLDWLGNGEIKLFKSPTEGNYLVRLTNISLAPEEKLGRMLHSFSCTAYEVKECNYESLLELGFYKEEGE